MNDNPILACILFAKSQGLACADEAEAERDALIAALREAQQNEKDEHHHALGLDEENARLQAERDAANALLRDVISEVEEYQKLPLTDRLQRQLLAYKSALRGVEQRAEDDPDSPLTNPAYDVPGQPR